MPHNLKGIYIMTQFEFALICGELLIDIGTALEDNEKPKARKCKKRIKKKE